MELWSDIGVSRFIVYNNLEASCLMEFSEPIVAFYDYSLTKNSIVHYYSHKLDYSKSTIEIIIVEL